MLNFGVAPEWHPTHKFAMNGAMSRVNETFSVPFGLTILILASSSSGRLRLRHRDRQTSPAGRILVLRIPILAASLTPNVDGSSERPA